MKKFNYYYDYSPEVYDYIMSSNILRHSEKELLKKLIQNKTTDELAKEYNLSSMTICRKRKKIFELTKCLMDYKNEDGNIEEYYKKHKENKLKLSSDLEKIVSEDTSLYKVYLLTFPSNKVYIGITSQEEKNRWKDGKGYIENEIMYNDILNYGWNNIKKNILYNNLTFEEAREKEKELIIKYKSNLKKYGYNRNF